MVSLLKNRKTGDYWNLIECSADLGWFLVAQTISVDAPCSGEIKLVSAKKLQEEFAYVRSYGV